MRRAMPPHPKARYPRSTTAARSITRNYLDFRAAKTEPPAIMNKITPPTRPAPAEWLKSLAKSDAELEAGQTVPAADVHARIRDCIDRIDAKRADG